MHMKKHIRFIALGLLGVTLTFASCKKDEVVNDTNNTIQLAMDGSGVVLESLALAQNAIEYGRLVPFSSAYPAMRFGSYWIVCPERHLKRKSVTAFMNWIRDKSDVYDAGVKHAEPTLPAGQL